LGTWNYLPTIIGLQFERELEPIERLAVEMANPFSNRTDIRKLAAEGLGRLDILQREIAAKMPRPSIVLTNLGYKPNWTWDQANQWYLAASALSGSYHDAKGTELRQKLQMFRRYIEEPQSQPNEPQFYKAVEEVRRVLPFTATIP
jgi:hypothetical protein